MPLLSTVSTRKALVTRVESADDRRVRMVALSPMGKKLIVPIYWKHAAAIQSVLSVSSDQLQLENYLKQVGRRAEALGAG